LDIDNINVMGIYQIRNLINDNVYIGSSGNIRKRWIQHRSGLKSNRHSNPHLQSSWNKYGEDTFVFEKIEDVNREQDLIGREQWFLDNVIRWGTDYNKSKIADSPMKGLFHTEETKTRMSNAQRGKKNHNWGKTFSKKRKKKMSDDRRGKKSYMWGTHRSKETKKKIGDAQRGEKNHASKLTEDNILKIRKLYSTGKYFQKELGKMFGVSRGHIGYIVTRKSWTHL